MAYGDFTLSEIERKFGVKNQVVSLFDNLTLVKPSDFLKTILNDVKDLPVRTEKAKSESIVFPILLELRNRNQKYFTIYSGDNLNVDEANGLKGECDFILAKDTHSYDLNYPIIQVVGAKRNDIEVGVAQCAAQLLGARLFNEQKGVKLDVIYGCVTTGDDWLFMKLDKDIFIDNRKYYLSEIEELLAIFQQIIDFYKEQVY